MKKHISFLFTLLAAVAIAVGCTGQLTATPVPPSGFATAYAELQGTTTAEAAILPVTPAIIETLSPTPNTAITPPPVLTDAIPAAKYDYVDTDGYITCTPFAAGTDEEIQCVTPDMPFVDKVAHAVFLESYNNINMSFTMDLLQLLLNEDYNAWTCSIRNCTSLEHRALNPLRIPWSNITPDQFERLTLYIMSEPYYPSLTNRTLAFPVWNSWSRPLLLGDAKTNSYPDNYTYTVQAVQQMLDKCVGFNLISGYACNTLTTKSGQKFFAQHAVRPVDVLYVYETTNHLLCNAPVMATDTIRVGNDVIYAQFLTRSGAGYDRSCN